MSEKYINSPIQEALCEFAYRSNKPWDLTIPGLVYDRIKEQFPIKRYSMAYGISTEERERTAKPKIEFAQRIQFVNDKNDILVQIGQNILSINHLSPYSSWENFKPQIINVFNIYTRITEPEKLSQIALRYINRIVLKKTNIEIEDYFRFFPSLPKEIPDNFNVFHMVAGIPYRENLDKLQISIGSVSPNNPEENYVNIILDIHYSTTDVEKKSVDEISNWIEQAHLIIGHTFEKCITDKCREIFKGE